MWYAPCHKVKSFLTETNPDVLVKVWQKSKSVALVVKFAFWTNFSFLLLILIVFFVDLHTAI